MKDIDFDELDKAVNSLMATTPGGSNPVVSVPPATADAPVQPITPSAAPAPASSDSTVSGSAPIPVVVRSAPPAARRSGRFMDMVHTSSEMKSRTEVQTPVATPSREGLAIAPRAEATAPVVSTPEIAPQQPSSVESTPQSMPDPIDMTPAAPEPTPETPAPAVEIVDEPVSDTMETGAIESPFLSDAKVEKRPLNAGVPVEEPAKPTVDLSQALLEDESEVANESKESNDDQNGSDEPPITPQVPELSNDLVAIESGEQVDTTQAVETSDVVNQIETPSVPLGPTSIAQQYKQQPSTGDQSHAAIYDASQYPEPLTHPAKSRSGWLWIVWVILLLGVGAGGAVLLYNLGIIP